jgi:cation:H+ antiporter
MAAGAPAEVRRGTGGPWALQIALVIGGLALLVLGAGWMVEAASAFARRLGVSELVIGLTVLAAGTSLPEAAASAVAALRGQRDIAVGNVIGSNLFNVLGVAGLAAVAAPAGLAVAPAVLAFDLPVMVAAAVACLPIVFTGHRVARWEGGLFVGLYLAYTIYLILAAQAHDALRPFSLVMLAAVLPLVATTLAIVSWREWRARRPHAPDRTPGAN